jgi:hypothetical protein
MSVPALTTFASKGCDGMSVPAPATFGVPPPGEPPALVEGPEAAPPFETYGESSSGVRPPHADANDALSTSHDRFPFTNESVRATERRTQRRRRNA